MYTAYQQRVKREWSKLAGVIRKSLKEKGLLSAEIDYKLSMLNTELYEVSTGKSKIQLLNLCKEKNPEMKNPTMLGGLSDKEAEIMISKYMSSMMEIDKVVFDSPFKTLGDVSAIIDSPGILLFVIMDKNRDLNNEVKFDFEFYKKYTKLSKTTLRKYLKKLVESGVISLIENNVYKLNVQRKNKVEINQDNVSILFNAVEKEEQNIFKSCNNSGIAFEKLRILNNIKTQISNYRDMK